jgi:hypothetical protein
LKIKLQDLAHALEQSDVFAGYVDLAEGRVIVCGDQLSPAAEETGTSDADQLERALSIEDDWQRYVALPNACDVDMKQVLQQFAATLTGSDSKNELLAALQGAGAVTRSERLLRRLGMEPHWQTYLHHYFIAIARDWCEENNVEYEDET